MYHIRALYTTHTPSFNTRRRQHISVQHRGSKHPLLHVNFSAEIILHLHCNSTSTSSITKLQRLQNSLARVVLQQPRWTHAEPLLRSLHWLPVEYRVTYKLAVLTYNVRLTATPAYLNTLISNSVTVSRMTLRSSTRSLMAVPRTNTVCASRSFSVCAPVKWNSFPPKNQLCRCLKTFKSKLKTFLFSRAFNIWPVAKRFCILGLHDAI